MSTGGDPEGRPAGGPAGDGERARNALAYPLAGGAAAAVLCVIVLAAVDPSPGRHLRGLLILLAIVGLLAVSWGWARTVWYGPVADGQPGDRGTLHGRDAEHVE